MNPKTNLNIPHKRGHLWKSPLVSIASLLSLGLASQGADFHSDFDEATIGDITGLGIDTPNPAIGDVSLNTTNQTLDLVTGNADMWGTRNNAPIAWVASPVVDMGKKWMVETYIAMEKDGSNTREVGGLTFYDGPDGAKPDFTFGLDDWNGWSVRLQGLGDNNPNVGGTDLGAATGVFLRVEITEAGATDTYNFFYKELEADPWSQLGGVAIDFASSFPNSRVGVTLKSNADGGAAQYDFLTVGEIVSADTDSDGLPDDWEMAQTGYVDLDTFDGTITDPMGASGSGSGDFDGDGLADIKEYDPGAPFLPIIDSTDAGNPDSDGDTLLDGVETRTGVWVSASNTGTDPNDDDSDGDDLFDDEETGDGNFVSDTETGTDPNKPDTDGDGLNDNLEVLTLGNPPYNPNVDDSGSDVDMDNSTLAEELANGTDYTDPDSDDDDLLDGNETNDGTYDSLTDTGTDPLNPDSDSDGVRDGVEVNSVYLFGPIDALQAGTNGGFGSFDGGIDGAGDGTGTVSGTFDLANELLNYTITWQDLTSAVSNMHFHLGAPGVSGGVQLAVPGPWASPQVGIDVSVTGAEKDNLLAGDWYINIHTDNFGGGEVRGQVLVTSTDPNMLDTDSDGWDDRSELLYGTNPNLDTEFPSVTGLATVSLIQDLDAEVGVTGASLPLVDDWANQAPSGGDDVGFIGTATGDAEVVAAATPTGLDAVDFDGNDRLIGDDPDAFDQLIQGTGLTWLAVVKVAEQTPATANDNRIFGNLMFGNPWSGFMANIESTETIANVFRPGPASGDQFKTISATVVNDGNWHVLGGRVAAGLDVQLSEVFIDSAIAEASGNVTVKPAANSAELTIGAERIAGGEFGTFTLARLLIYERPLVDAELAEAVAFLDTTYIGDVAPAELALEIDSLVGTTLTMTITGGASNAEYVCNSTTNDLTNITTPETTDPALLMTDGSGTATFSIDIGARTELFVVVEEVVPQ